jgi:hypothetical protein
VFSVRFDEAGVVVEDSELIDVRRIFADRGACALDVFAILSAA